MIPKDPRPLLLAAHDRLMRDMIAQHTTPKTHAAREALYQFAMRCRDHKDAFPRIGLN